MSHVSSYVSKNIFHCVIQILYGEIDRSYFFLILVKFCTDRSLGSLVFISANYLYLSQF